MRLIKKVTLIILAAFSPLPVYAFWSLCFPISFIILSFILGWPGPFIYELLPKSISEPILDKGFYGTFVLGLAIDLIILILIGFWLDKRNQSNLSFRQSKVFKLPLYFILAVILLAGLMFIDPTCRIG